MSRRFFCLQLVIFLVLLGLTSPMAGGATAKSSVDSGISGVTDRKESGGERSPIEAAFDDVGPLSVAISGPVSGVSTDEPRMWMATIAPLSVTVPVTYTWQTAEQSPIVHSGTTTDTVLFSWSSPGTKTITVTASNAAGTVEDTHEVTVDAPVSGLSATNSSPNYLGRKTLFTATVEQGTSVTYDWSFGDGKLGSGEIVTHTYSALGTYTATVTATNPVSILTDETVVTVVELPVSGLLAFNGGPTSTGQNTMLFAMCVGTSVAYEWDFGDGGSALTEEGTLYHEYPAAAVYTAVVTASNSVNTQTTSTTVTIQDDVAGLQILDNTPAYVGDTVEFTATLAAGTAAGYLWSYGDGQGDNGQQVSHAYAAVGDYTTAVTATNLVSSQSVTKTVSISDVPAAGLQAESDSPTQLGAVTTFTASVASGTSVAYLWALGDDHLGSGRVISNTYQSVGIYTATVTATNAVSELVEQVPVLVTDVPVAGLEADNDGPTPLGSSTSLSATAAAGTNVEYAWTFGDGQTGIGHAVSHPYGVVGTYTATVTATNSVGFAVAGTVVDVQETITGLAAENDSPTVLGETTTMTATVSSGSGVAYSWAFGDGQIGSGWAVNHTYPAFGTYTVVVTATNAVGSQSATTAVVVDAPIVDLTADNSSPTATGNSTLLGATLGGGSRVSYEWAWGDGSPNGSGYYGWHQYPSAGWYTATVTGTNSVSIESARTTVHVQDAVTGLAGQNSSPTLLGASTALSATVSAGTAVGYTWQFGDGTNGAGQHPSHTYGAVRTYTATVTAANLVSSKTSNTLVNIVDVPVSGLSAEHGGRSVAGMSTYLTATVAAGSNVAYTWDLGDGQGAAGRTVEHIYALAGSYTATITASNSVGPEVANMVISIDPAVYYVYAPIIFKDFVCNPDPYEPNDDPAHAYVLTGPTTLWANFCGADQKDEYEFHVATTSVPIKIDLQRIPTGCDYDVYLYQLPDTSSPKAWSDATGNADEHISYQPVQAGDYMVFVYARTKCPCAGSTDYELQVDFE